MWYLYTIEFYSATEKNEILSFPSLSKVSQDQKAKSHMLAVICEWSHSGKVMHERDRETKNLNRVDIPTIQV
jgi:hypothetical protein